MSTAQDFVDPELTISNIICDTKESVLECIATSKGRVPVEKENKVDMKGKVRESPTGMMLRREDLRMLTWLRECIQDRLDYFDTEKAREKDRAEQEKQDVSDSKKAREEEPTEQESQGVSDSEKVREEECADKVKDQERQDISDNEKAREVEHADKEKDQKECGKASEGGLKPREASTSESDESLIMTPQDDGWEVLGAEALDKDVEDAAETLEDNDEVRVVEN